MPFDLFPVDQISAQLKKRLSVQCKSTTLDSIELSIHPFIHPSTDRSSHTIHPSIHPSIHPIRTRLDNTKKKPKGKEKQFTTFEFVLTAVLAAVQPAAIATVSVAPIHRHAFPSVFTRIIHAWRLEKKKTSATQCCGMARDWWQHSMSEFNVNSWVIQSIQRS